jgi:hypothetical protein
MDALLITEPLYGGLRPAGVPATPVGRGTPVAAEAAPCR